MRLTRLLTDKEIELANDYSTREEAKRKNGDYTILDNVKPFDVVNKLGQLEEIEEELGIELVVIFKIILERKPIYYKHTGWKEITEILKGYVGNIGKDGHLEIIPIFDREQKDMFDFFRNTYYAKDYGKTWALTRKELE